MLSRRLSTLPGVKSRVLSVTGPITGSAGENQGVSSSAGYWLTSIPMYADVT